MMKKICDFIAFKTKYIVNYNLEGISLLEDGKESKKSLEELCSIVIQENIRLESL